MTTRSFSMRKFFSLISTLFLFVFGFVFCKPIIDGMPRIRFANSDGNVDIHRCTRAEIVSNDTPAMTFLTHGLGGRASDWSNNYKENFTGSLDYVEDEFSIISKMKVSLNNRMSLYRAYYGNNLPNVHEGYGYAIFRDYSNNFSAQVDTITDFNSHIVVVVDLDNYTYQPMKDVYDKFHHIVDKFLYDYYSVKNAIPKINLIGHSMGGLLNMQYTIDHPANVASLISLGTPYNGSFYNNNIVNLFVQDFKLQQCMCGDCGHGYYFCDLQRRKQIWNETISQYPHIKFYALAGQITIDFVHYLIRQYYSSMMIEEGVYAITTAFSHSSIPGLILVSTIELLLSVLPGDICVDLDSQKAVGYDGVINYTKHFNSVNCNIHKVSRNNIPVPHNLEAYDEDLVNCILGVIDFGGVSNSISYIKNDIKVNIISKLDDKWIIRLTNNSSADNIEFDYNEKMCSHNDAKTWNNLCDIRTTGVLSPGEFTVIEIMENYFATDITISYVKNGRRIIFYADNLSRERLSLSPYSYEKNNYIYTSNNIEISIISKESYKWQIKLTNRSVELIELCYNNELCLSSEAMGWSNLSEVKMAKRLHEGESTIISVNDNSRDDLANYMALSYITDDSRSIIYANNLSRNGTMTINTRSIPFCSATHNNIRVGVIGKSYNKWLIRITNLTGNTRNFAYNYKMCFESDARDWKNLTDVFVTYPIETNQSLVVEVKENVVDCIAISYIEGDKRNIFYAKNFDLNGFSNSSDNVVDTFDYPSNGINLSLVGKNGTKWSLKIVNNTGSAKRIEYNSKMCNEVDAKNWQNLTDITTTKELLNSESTCIVIEENFWATHIAISYIDGDYRYIIYANELNPSGKMNVSETKRNHTFTKNGISLSIVRLTNVKGVFLLTNNTNKERSFEYASTTQLLDDARNWKNIVNYHVTKVLSVGETIEIEIVIKHVPHNEALFDTLAISYLEGNYRYGFYANNLDNTDYMNANANTIDLNAPPTECVAEGSLITLADGTQKPVEELTGDELLLVWNLETGTYDYAPILFIDSDPIGHYEVINLTFSDNTQVNVISEHGFYDVDINQYVYLDKNAYNYIGHNFKSETGNVTLTNVEINTVVTRAYSPVTYGHLCYYVDGMLSMPGGIEGLFNYFDVDSNTMKYDEESKNADIQQYGLFTYEEFNELIPVPEEIFNAVNGQYLKAAIGKGMITLSQIQQLVNRYSVYF